MKILALEFSSPQRSAAVVEGRTGLQPLFWSEMTEGGEPRTPPLVLVEKVLNQSQVDREQIECLAVGLGPGSYNGIRAAIALAQGWQLARPIKLLGVSSAECLAAQAQQEKIFGRVNIVIDAQRNEVYLAGYDIDAASCKEVEPLRLTTLEEAQSHTRVGGIMIGPDVTRWFADGQVIFPSAAMLGRLAAARTDFVSGDKLEPIYLRETSFVKAPPPRVVPDI